ncbi:MAG TPA: FAD-dependent oxidoreductase [Rhizomicrobium sp.]
MSGFCDIAIIGAGPYGLSLAAHLAETGARFRIFGKPLDSWRAHMPAGMLLKSDGFASNLSSPDPDSTLKAYCAARGHAYDDQLLPVALSLFNEYSSWFQKRYVPALEERQVTALEKTSQGYRLTLDNGEVCEVASVVLAVGITWFAKTPDILSGLPDMLVSHSFNNNRLERHAGRAVTVLGAGSSAIDTAALLAEAGADVTLLARSPHLHFHGTPDPDGVSWLRQLTHPSSGIGPGWRSFFCTKAPRLFRRLPQNFRLEATRRHLGPAAGWFMRERIRDHVNCLLRTQLTGAVVKDGRVALTAQCEGQQIALAADHVISATGYRPDLRRLAFLSNEIRGRILQVAHTPHLSDDFETSMDGLYVIGPLAANSFGPLMRFMVGAEYAAPRLARRLCGERKNHRQALSV